MPIPPRPLPRPGDPAGMPPVGEEPAAAGTRTAGCASRRSPPRPPRLVIALVLVLLPMAVLAPPRAADAETGDRVSVDVAGETAPRTLEGEIVIEAVDGGMLLRLDDQRLELVQPADVRGKRVLEPGDDADAPAPRELGKRILAELPEGFDLLVTRHYVVCFDTSRAYAQWCAALFERLRDAFVNYWKKAGLEVATPRDPLVVVIFADRRRYEAFAARDLGAAADRVVGYYNILTNRVTTFDLTGSDLLARRPTTSASRAGLEILSSPEAAGLVSTLVHEASHQMAFNCGLHRRLAPVPVWLSEGVATFFETPDAGGRGWKGIGGVNRPRLEKFLAGYRPGVLERIVLSDDPFRDPDEGVDAYARAWALTAFLAQTRKAELADYMATMAAKEPLSDDDPDLRRREFVAAFGAEPADLEEPLLKFLARWK